MSDIRDGDTVRWACEGVVEYTCSDPGLVGVSFSDDVFRLIRKKNLELVSRPVTKVAVELTYEQLDHLCVRAAAGSPTEIYQTLNDARNVAYEETYG